MAEDEAAIENSETLIEVPKGSLPAIRKLIAKFNYTPVPDEIRERFRPYLAE